MFGLVFFMPQSKRCVQGSELCCNHGLRFPLHQDWPASGDLLGGQLGYLGERVVESVLKEADEEIIVKASPFK